VPADWIGEMRPRGKGIAPVAATSREPTTAEMVQGRWHCFDPIGGRNWQFEYGGDNILRVTWGDGRQGYGRYSVAGKRITYRGNNGDFSLDIESIGEERMVQFMSFGDRLACERR
jgi:hypothetical protein